MEAPRAPQESASRKETPQPKQEKGGSVEDEKKKQEQEFRRASARLEMSIEDTTNVLSGGIEKADPDMKDKIINALVDNIKDIPQEKRQALLEQVRTNIDARVEEAHARQMKPEEIMSREANAQMMKEIDSRLFIDLPEQEGNAIELTEVVDDDVIELTEVVDDDAIELDLDNDWKKAA